VIRGKLTTLRPVSLDDLPLLERWFADPEVFQYWGGVPKPREGIAAEYLGIENGDEIVLSFIVQHDGEPIGYIQAWSDEPLIGGIDLVLVPRARDRGYGPDAARALALYLRDDLRWTEITVDPLIANARAIRAFEKAGFVFQRDAPNHPDGPSLIMTFQPGAATKPGHDPAGPESTSVDPAGD
jgi:aminoglycoside 6'-N-acetyltransferase